MCLSYIVVSFILVSDRLLIIIPHIHLDIRISIAMLVYFAFRFVHVQMYLIVAYFCSYFAGILVSHNTLRILRVIAVMCYICIDCA